MSETFIKIDSLQHLEISRQTYPTYRSKICVTTFTVLIMRTIHTSMIVFLKFEFIASFECKTLTILTLKCTSDGYMYCPHQFGKISITSKQCGIVNQSQ